MRHAALAFLAALILSRDAQAQLTKADHARLEESIPPTVYLRIDLPCVYGRLGLMVHWVQPMVFVSPTGVSVSQDEGWRGGVIGPKRNMFWGLGPNDPLKYTRLEIGADGVVTVYFLGLGPKQQRKDLTANINLVSCKTAADFQAAFDRAFSKVPLQDEHPEWSTEIRKAIGEHSVTPGMSRQQVLCVTGTPVDIEGAEEGAAKTEIWHLRGDKGVWAGVFDRKTIKSGAASRVIFVDGQVTKIESDPPPATKK